MLTPEWKNRIMRWRDALWKCIYRPIKDIEWSGLTTNQRLNPQQALQQPFAVMPTGTTWGSKWEYGWFKCCIIIPPEAAGQRVVLYNEAGPESLVWINGQVAGSFGWARQYLVLTRQAEAGQVFEILMETYAGHGKVSTGEGPLLSETSWMPEPPAAQCTLGQSNFGIWLEPVYQLALDFTTLYELRDTLDPLSLRASEIDDALMAATCCIDLELPEDRLLETIQQGRRLLAPVLACKNGSTSPTLHAFGHAHIDVAWLWPLQETERKMARTVANQLALADEYPEYRFLQSQPQLYLMLKNHYPELYQRLKNAVRQNQFIPDGMMWVEADTNISSGESLIRQILHGRKFFEDEFGINSQVLWLPDVFGYSGAVPQILRGCGCIGFATQKITWAYNGGEPFPYNTFLWEGIDGTTIPAHIFTDYNSETSPRAIAQRWNTRLQKNGIRSLLLSFGWGDGGGGPTSDHIEYIRRTRDLEGLPRVELSSPAAFFNILALNGSLSPRYVGELYFQAHRGTYTSQARTKQGNRYGEFALREAELWATAASALGKFKFTARTLDSAWQALLTNQFHDILPGSSIQRVYQEAEAAYQDLIHTAQLLARQAVQGLTHPAEAVTIFNSLSWPRQVLVETPDGSAEITVPACGWKTVPLAELAHSEQPDETRRVSTTPHSLENHLLHAEFNDRGEITRLFDKQSQRDFAAGPLNRFCLYKDVPSNWDAWDIESMVENLPVEIDEPVTLEVIASSPQRGALLLTRRLHDSILTQVISLCANSRRVEFDTTIEWQESHKLLKVCFPFNIHTNEALHEIQFGHLRRPTHKSRPFDADRFEVSQYKWSALVEEGRGAAILNDCKYGLSTSGNTLKLSLLKSPKAPDPFADTGTHHFTYAIYTWNGSFLESGLVQAAYELNIPPLVIKNAGTAGAAQESLFRLDKANIVIETVKPAEDGSSDIVIRMYEAMRTATRCNLLTTFNIVRATQTDLLENQLCKLPNSRHQVELDFRPFEIKTIHLQIQP